MKSLNNKNQDLVKKSNANNTNICTIQEAKGKEKRTNNGWMNTHLYTLEFLKILQRKKHRVINKRKMDEEYSEC